MVPILSTCVHFFARFLIVWVLFFLPAMSASIAQTVLTGALTVDTQLDISGSPYLIEGELVVQSGARLFIGPGITIYMGSGARLRVDSGSLQVRGVFDQPVHVMSDKVRQGKTGASGDWDQWVFNSGAVSTHLENVVFEHGRGLAVYGSAPVFDYLILRHHQGAAITVDLAASPSGEGNQATGNTLNGIAVPAGDITGTVKWAVKGIPYIVSSGVVSVGDSPRITAVTPSLVEQGKIMTLLVSGQRLKEITQAVFDKTGLSLTPFPGASDTQASFQLVVDASAEPGPRTLTLQTAAGFATLLNAVTVAYAKPVLESLVPAVIETGSIQTELTIKGNNFIAQSEVLLNGAIVPATLVSMTELKAIIPAQSAEGTLQIQVRSPDPKVPGEFLLSNVLSLPIKSAPLPKLSVEPNPIVLLPDGLPHQIVVQLDKPHGLDHVVTLEVADPSRLSVVPGSIKFLAGQTRILVSLTPQANQIGANTLTLRANSLQSTQTVPVFVTRDAAGANTAFSELIGVTVGKRLPTETASVMVTHPTVGVAVGAVLTEVQPARWRVGQVQDVVITGQGIVPGVQVTLTPDAGVMVEPPVVSADGSQISIKVDIAESAELGVRGVEVRDAAGMPLVFADPERAVVQLTGALPEIDSVDPILVEPGTLTELIVRGRNLQNGSVHVSPGSGLQIDQSVQINPEGTQLSVRLQVEPTAELGERLVQIHTSSGESPAVMDVNNTFRIVERLLDKEKGRVVASVPVGVRIGSPAESFVGLELHGQPVGVIVGEGVAAVLPSQALSGKTTQVKVTGSGLENVTAIVLEPAEGVEVQAFSTYATGETLDFTLHVDADAVTGIRSLVLKTANGTMPFAHSDGDRFTLATSFPELMQIEPQVIAQGDNAARKMRLMGRNLHGMRDVRIEPSEGVIATGPFSVNPEGTEAYFTVKVTAAAATGKRTVIVTADAGVSTPVTAESNSFLIAGEIGPRYDSIVSSVVGVRIGSGSTGGVSARADIVSPAIGVLVEEESTPSDLDVLVQTAPVGVWLGDPGVVIDQLSPTGWLQGANGFITVSGKGLGLIASAEVVPATGILLGALSVNAEGTELQIPISVADTAPEVLRELLLTTQDGELLSLENQNYGRFGIGRLPQLTSVTPVQVAQGKTVQLAIRGTDLKGVTSLRTEPDQGVRVLAVPVWQQDALGELLQVSIQILPDAELGPRAIRLEVPGGLTSSESTHFNTIRIISP